MESTVTTTKSMKPARVRRPRRTVVPRPRRATRVISTQVSTVPSEECDEDCKKNKVKNYYAQLLVNPFMETSSKLPKYNLGKSFAFHRRVNLTIPLPNANGCFVFFEPNNYTTTANYIGNYSPLLVDNGPTYNPTTGATNAIAPIDLSALLNLATTNVDVVRIVACGLYMWVTDTPINLKGTIYAGVQATAFQPLTVAAPTLAPQLQYTTAYINRLDHITVPVTSSNVGVRYCYRPRSMTDIMGKVAGTQTPVYETSDRFVATLVGLGPTASLNIALSYHFEATLDPNGDYAEFGNYLSATGDPFDAVSILSAQPSLFLSAMNVSESGFLGTANAQVATTLTQVLPNIPSVAPIKKQEGFTYFPPASNSISARRDRANQAKQQESLSSGMHL